MNWLLKRLREPSSYAGLAAVAYGAADAVSGAGNAVAAGMPWYQALAVTGFGALAVFAGEKGRR